MSGPLQLLLITGTRADFGLWLPLLNEASRRGDRLHARLLVTAMHLDPRFGQTADEVRRSGFEIAAEVPCTAPGDSRSDMAAALGTAVERLAPVVAEHHPDWLLVLGDRGEQLAAALGALHAGIAVAHLHGGEVTRGAIDDTIRDLVTRIAHLHLAATQDAAERLQRVGEEAWRIHVVGAPGLDRLKVEAGGDLAALRAAHGLGDDGPYLLLVHHPETVGPERSVPDLEAVLDAVHHTGIPALAIFPNADAGGRAMADRLLRAGGTIQVVTSLPRSDFVTLLAGAAALVGNSSSGIIEAPLLGVPAVNVGDRQAGRTRGDNVIDVAAEADAIGVVIARAIDPAFRAGLSRSSPYGDGATAPRVIDLLESIPRDGRLLVKRVGDPDPGAR